MKRSTPKPLSPSPVQQGAAFTPPPTGVVTVAGMNLETIEYWKTIRVAWLSGYNLNWVIPGREGATGSSSSVWNLDVRVQPVFDTFPARTAQHTLEPYVLVGGRPSIEPEYGTRVTVKFNILAARSAKGPGVLATEPPTDLGETARWLPTPASYSTRWWQPSGGTLASPDQDINWEGSEENLPVIHDEYMYDKQGEWVTTTAMSIQSSNYFRLNGMPLYTGVTPNAPVTMFFVADIVAPTKYWGSLLRAVEPDGSSDLTKTNLDLRLMPDGNLHPYTWGWQLPLPLVGDNHAMSLFGFYLNPLDNTARLFTIDHTLQIVEFELPTPHSSTSKFVLGRTAEALFSIYLLDVLFYRGPMTNDRIEFIASELDAAYGISRRVGQEQE